MPTKRIPPPPRHRLRRAAWMREGGGRASAPSSPPGAFVRGEVVPSLRGEDESERAAGPGAAAGRRSPPRSGGGPAAAGRIPAHAGSNGRAAPGHGSRTGRCCTELVRATSNPSAKSAEPVRSASAGSSWRSRLRSGISSASASAGCPARHPLGARTPVEPVEPHPPRALRGGGGGGGAPRAPFRSNRIEAGARRRSPTGSRPRACGRAIFNPHPVRPCGMRWKDDLGRIGAESGFGRHAGYAGWSGGGDRPRSRRPCRCIDPAPPPAPPAPPAVPVVAVSAVPSPRLRSRGVVWYQEGRACTVGSTNGERLRPCTTS